MYTALSHAFHASVCACVCLCRCVCLCVCVRDSCGSKLVEEILEMNTLLYISATYLWHTCVSNNIYISILHIHIHTHIYTCTNTHGHLRPSLRASAIPSMASPIISLLSLSCNPIGYWMGEAHCRGRNEGRGASPA